MRNNMDNSSVFKDFVKIAESYGWVKEADDPKVIQDKYNVTDETGEELIDKAHPDEIWVADALGDGGLVENQNEQHDTLMELLYKMPEGSLIGRHATMVDTLTKTANDAFVRGDYAVYNKINDSIDTLNKTAFWPAIGGVASFIGRALLPFIGKQVGKKIVPHIGGKALMMGGVGSLLAGLGSKLTSIQEDIHTDIQDALETCNEILGEDDMKDIHTQTKQIVGFITPYSQVFAGAIPEEDQEIAEYLFALGQLNKLVEDGGRVRQLAENISSSATWHSFGFSDRKTIEENVIDIEKSIEATFETFNTMGEKYKEGIANIKEDKSKVAQLLENAGYSAKKGVGSALQAVEREIAKLYPKAAGKIAGRLTEDNVSAGTLEKLLRAAGKI